jgi:hypothetical protein
MHNKAHRNSSWHRREAEVPSKICKYFVALYEHQWINRLLLKKKHRKLLEKD